MDADEKAALRDEEDAIFADLAALSAFTATNAAKTTDLLPKVPAPPPPDEPRSKQVIKAWLDAPKPPVAKRDLSAGDAAKFAGDGSGGGGAVGKVNGFFDEFGWRDSR